MEVFTTKLKGSQMVYHNYWNTRLINEFKKCGFDHNPYVKYNISDNPDGTKKKCTEVVMYTNYRKKSLTPKQCINNTVYQPMVKSLEKVS